MKTIKGGATSATPTILAPGPSGQNRKMEDVQGWFVNGTAANPPVATGTPWEAPAGNKNTNWWDGIAGSWSLGSSVPLPSDTKIKTWIPSEKYIVGTQVSYNDTIWQAINPVNENDLSPQFNANWKPIINGSTYQLHGDNANYLDFARLVKNIFVDTNGNDGNYRISYVVKNSDIFQKLAIQIVNVNDTTKVGTFYFPYDSELKPNSIVPLLNHSEEPLNALGFKVSIEANNFEQFGTDSYNQFVESSAIFFNNNNVNIANSLAVQIKSTARIVDLNTYSLAQNTSNDIVNWFSLLKGIYIDNKKELVAPERYGISYIWQNDNNNPDFGRFGLQIKIDNIHPSNYGLPMSIPITSIKKGELIKLDVVDTEETASYLDIYVIFDESKVFPQTRMFHFLDRLLSPFNSSAILNNVIPIVNKAIDLNKSQPTIMPFLLSEESDKWFSAIENIYLIDPKRNIGDEYSISYYWQNHTLGKFGLQLYKNGTDPTNFTFSGSPEKGSIEKLSSDPSEALSYIDIIIEFNDITTDSFLGYLEDRKEIFLPAAFQYEKTKQIIELASGVKENTKRLNLSENGVNAIQNAIDSIFDASPNNIYNLRVGAGLYKITNSSQFLGNPGYPAMILMKDHVNIIGDSKEDCVLWAELPYNDTDIDTSIPRTLHQTIYNWSDNCLIENFTIVAKNMRYVLHQDNPQEASRTRYYKNCDFIFLGDKGNLVALGIGTWSGSKTYVEGGRSYSAYSNAFACHNNVAFSDPSLWHFKGHTFSSEAGAGPIAMQNSGSLISDVVVFENCKTEGDWVLNYLEWWIYSPGVNDHFNHADWKIKGFGNAPMYFNNEVDGKALKIEASTIGEKVRFDNTSSAYPILITNNKKYWGYLGHPEREIVDQYVVFDSTSGLNSYAIGGKSIKESNYPFGVNLSQDSLGKRLGNCSVVNKNLGIIIGSATINIVFNKNYTAFTNAEVIAEINTALGTKGMASEYNVGKDYYPEFTDCNFLMTNATTEVIEKGSFVTRVGSKIKKADINDEVFGIAIDDIAPFSIQDGLIKGKGRVVKNMIFNVSDIRVKSGQVVIKGKKYAADNGELVEDENGLMIGFEDNYILIGNNANQRQ
ncbi:hypothetical protein [Sphingobacterium multivorum]|uniref:hypothetical protein n=1 Tax=Sphingobacterium multivorum TaxID=28454 RepID=UPI0013305665|nr:hypothetical protein [Sphingobacterium multivorum]